MGMVENLMGGGGIPAQTAAVIAAETQDNAPVRSVATGLTATGTVIGDALQLTAFISLVGTTALSTGVKLPPNWPIGQWGFVYNGGANPLNLFPPTATIKINGGTDGAAVTIAAAAGNLIMRHSATDFGVYVMAKET